MKKYLFLLISILLISEISYSQNKGYAAISFGPSLPVGDFASKKITNDKAGFANPGGLIAADYIYKLNKNIGVASLLHFQFNSFAHNRYRDQLTKYYGTNYPIRWSSWLIAGTMVGGYCNFPIAYHISLDTKLMIGLMSVTSPAIRRQRDHNSYPYEIDSLIQPSDVAISGAILLSGGIKFDVGRRMCIITSIDYLAADPHFTNTNSVTGNILEDEARPYTTLNFKVGVGFRFGRVDSDSYDKD